MPKPANTLVTNCVFNGVVWDKATLETIQTVAQGLLNLTELFKSQNVKINSLLQVGEPPDAKTLR